MHRACWTTVTCSQFPNLFSTPKGDSVPMSSPCLLPPSQPHGDHECAFSPLPCIRVLQMFHRNDLNLYEKYKCGRGCLDSLATFASSHWLPTEGCMLRTFQKVPGLQSGQEGSSLASCIPLIQGARYGCIRQTQRWLRLVPRLCFFCKDALIA